MKPIYTIDKMLRFISDKRIQLLFIVAITFVFYGNSINNDFAQDDGQYYWANQFVQKGFGGIHDLFTKESMYGYYGHSSLVNGGRWRPLPLITFAIEKEYFNDNPHVSHFINVLLLAITAAIMLLFLRRYLFISSPVAAFFVVLLFVIHPVHTEAVSHIKSRDELLSWLFLLLTMYCSLNFLSKRNYWQLVFSLVFYFLALLSKENGISFIAILPLTFYFFTKEKLRTIAVATLPFVAIFGIYALMRFSFVSVSTSAGSDVMLAPYLYATPVQHLATALMLLDNYILLLFWPNPLISIYSYDPSSYVNFSDWRVWLSVLIQSALVLYALLKIKEKNLVSYGILFYFLSIFMVSNILIDVGAFIGERFLYQPSFGFCIAVVATANRVFERIKFKKSILKFSIVGVPIIVVVLLSGFQTIRRNSEWNSTFALLSADVKKAPNSLGLHSSLAMLFLNRCINAPTPQLRIEDFNRASCEFDTAITIFPKYPEAWNEKGYLYYLMGDTNEAIKACLKCVDADSTFTDGYAGLGKIYYNAKNYRRAIFYFKKCVQLDSMNIDQYFNIGLCYHMSGQYEKEIQWYKKLLSLNLTQQEKKEDSVTLQEVRQNLIVTGNLLQNKNQ